MWPFLRSIARRRRSPGLRRAVSYSTLLPVYAGGTGGTESICGAGSLVGGTAGGAGAPSASRPPRLCPDGDAYTRSDNSGTLGRGLVRLGSDLFNYIYRSPRERRSIVNSRSARGLGTATRPGVKTCKTCARTLTLFCIVTIECSRKRARASRTTPTGQCRYRRGSSPPHLPWRSASNVVHTQRDRR